MKPDEQFGVTIAKAVLVSTNEDIQLAVLEEMVNQTGTASLESQLAEAKTMDKRAGDFGMEIIGPILLSALIEAGKALWQLYVKKLGDKAASKLADVTTKQIKDLTHSIWHNGPSVVTVEDYEMELRKAASKEGLSADQVERLVAAIRTEKMKNSL